MDVADKFVGSSALYYFREYFREMISKTLKKDPDSGKRVTVVGIRES